MSEEKEDQDNTFEEITSPELETEAPPNPDDAGEGGGLSKEPEEEPEPSEGSEESFIEVENDASPGQRNPPLVSPGEVFNKIYNNQFYCDICKSTLIFLIALKLAQECYKMHIPMRDYTPFKT